MTYERVTVVLREDEMNELRKLAQRELRKPRDQATYLLRRVLFGEQSVNANDDTTREGNSVVAAE